MSTRTALRIALLILLATVAWPASHALDDYLVGLAQDAAVNESTTPQLGCPGGTEAYIQFVGPSVVVAAIDGDYEVVCLDPTTKAQPVPASR